MIKYYLIDNLCLGGKHGGDLLVSCRRPKAEMACVEDWITCFVKISSYLSSRLMKYLPFKLK